MRGRGDGQAGAAGGPSRHVPVLLEEVCHALEAARGAARAGAHRAGRVLGDLSACPRREPHPLSSSGRTSSAE